MRTSVQKVTSDTGGTRESRREGVAAVSHSTSKAPEAGWCLTCGRKREGAPVAGAESVMGREGGQEGTGRTGHVGCGEDFEFYSRVMKFSPAETTSQAALPHEERVRGELSNTSRSVLRQPARA